MRIRVELSKLLRFCRKSVFFVGKHKDKIIEGENSFYASFIVFKAVSLPISIISTPCTKQIAHLLPQKPIFIELVITAPQAAYQWQCSGTLYGTPIVCYFPFEMQGFHASAHSQTMHWPKAFIAFLCILSADVPPKSPSSKLTGLCFTKLQRAVKRKELRLHATQPPHIEKRMQQIQFSSIRLVPSAAKIISCFLSNAVICGILFHLHKFTNIKYCLWFHPSYCLLTFSLSS